MELRSNVINHDETQEYIKVILEHLSKTLSRSLGPYGSTTIVQSEQLGHYMTKDGFTILKGIRYNSPIALTILQIIQDISAKLVMKVGDGSTSSIIAAQCLYDELNDSKDNKRPKEILDILNRLTEEINNELMNYKKDVSEDMHEIIDIASISLNNDNKIGSLIANIYKEMGGNGFINIELSDAPETYYEKSNGFQIDFGYLDKILVNTNTDECKLKNSNILMFNGHLDDIEYIKLISRAITEAETKQESLTILAPGFSKEIAGFFRQLITYSYANAGRKGNINIIEFPLATDHDENSFYDLSVKVGARIIQNKIGDMPEEDDITNFFGKADLVVSNYKSTSFLNSHGNKNDVDIRIGNIKNELQLMKDRNNNSISKKYELEKRLAVLEDKLFTIYIGGNSEHAKITNKYLIEDAIAACKSALRYGYVIGQNLSIPICIDRIIEKNKDNKDFEKYEKYIILIKNAFKNVFFKVINNKYLDTISEVTKDEIFVNCLIKECAYDLITENFSTKIINPVETEIEILKNVTSIISLLILSNQFLTINSNNEL